jgi:imidazolonepropionase-like amidohydrolase
VGDAAEPVPDRAVRTLAEYLRIGITTVRDAAGATPRLREAAARTLRPSPRLICSLMQLSSSRGPYGTSTTEELQEMAAEGIPSPVANGPAAFRAKVREYRAAGAEVIKVFATGYFAMPNRGAYHTLMSGEELKAIVGEASSLGMRVMAHAHGARGIVAAASAGVASVEHGLFLGPAGIGAMRANGTTLVPTLMAAEVLGMPDAAAHQRAAVGEAHRSGVRIAMGTDCPAQPHGTNLRELSLLVSCGLSPAEVLKAATVNAAELLGLGDRIGALKPGMDADLVVVRGDALDFAQLAERIEGVFVAGARVRG